MNLMKLGMIASLPIVLTSISGCSTVGQLANIKLTPTAISASPPVLAPFENGPSVTTAEEWETHHVPALREAFQRDLYGYFPDDVEIINTSIERVDEAAYDGMAVLDAVTLTVRMQFGEGKPAERDIRLVVAKPKSATGPVPVILKMESCPFNEAYQNDALPNGKSKFVFPVSAIEPDQLPDPLPEDLTGVDSIEATADATCEGQGSGIIGYSLGRYHYTPPVREAIEQGYAFASINVLDFVLDHGQIGTAQLELLSAGADADKAWGSLGAWAFQYLRAIDYLETDPTLDANKIAVYGHSRFGKAALLAGALDERIDAIISHQSGRGGAALFDSPTGEPIEKMIAQYPQWLSKSYNVQPNEKHSLPFDQHHLIALLAPRPVLLGHGRRDGWADPDGSYRAARGASPAYALYGSNGLTAQSLRDFDPAADIAYWMRPGTHGETKEDWAAFFEFLDSHFGSQ